MPRRPIPLATSPDTEEDKIILSIDIGTTQSAVAVYYSKPAVLHEPLVTYVARWPGQEATMHEEKVPSVLLYDTQGNLVACGAEATTRDISGEAEDRGYKLIEHFKLHLHPKELFRNDRLPLYPLYGISLNKIYTDFLSYLLAQTRRHLRDSTGSDPWPEMAERAEIVLSHPNRWGESQQKFLQKAAIAAGLVSEKGAAERLVFIEEGEASASFCMSTNATMAARLTPGSKFVICDAGGSTTDISAYKVRKTLAGIVYLKELNLPSCLYAGGVPTDYGFMNYLNERLHNAHDINAEDAPDMVADGLRDFQQSGKRKFGSVSHPCQVRIGARRMKSDTLPISKGILTITGEDAEGFFRPSVEVVLQDLRSRFGSRDISTLILTGGFGESPYVRDQLEKTLTDISKTETTIILSNSPNSKAVAIGALKLWRGGSGAVMIDRKERPWKTMVVNVFARIKDIMN